MTEKPEPVSVAVPLAVLAVVTLVVGNALWNGVRAVDNDIKEKQNER